MPQRITYTRDLLAEVAAQSTSINEMMRRLGVPLAGGTHSYLSKRLRHYGIDTSHFTDLNREKQPRHSYTREALAEAAAHSTSVLGVMQYLGVIPYNSAYGLLTRRLAELGIDTSHFAPATATGRTPCSRYPTVLPSELLAPAVAASTSVAGVIRALNLTNTNGSRRLIQRSVAEHVLDTSHFTGAGHALGKAALNRRPASDILVLRVRGSRREPYRRLRRALNEIGRDYRCCGCGNVGSWCGQTLVLEIDHVNGDWLDNRPENLRYLCPCCHSQTPTFRGRNRGHRWLPDPQ